MSGLDWYATLDSVLTNKLGWGRIAGYNSLYAKDDALMAVYVDDVILAGTPHARRREWAAIGEALELKEKPQKLHHSLGVNFEATHLDT